MVRDTQAVPGPVFRAPRRPAPCAPDPWPWRSLRGAARPLAAVVFAASCTPAALIAAGSGEYEDIPNVIVTDKRIDTRDELIASKIPLPAADIPLSAERIDTETIARTGFGTMSSLLQATTSATATVQEGGAFSNVLLRGFADTPIYRNGINDSLGQLPLRSLANVATIEVLKGPNGALYGPGEPGGSINFVTKRPQPERATDLAITLGSYSEFAVELDATGPLHRAANLDYRLIATREQSDTFRDFVKRNRLFVNPMIAWQPTAQLEFDASFEYIDDDHLLDTGVIAIDGALPLPDDRFLGEPSNGPAEIDGYTFQASSLFQIYPDWRLDLSVTGQKTRLEGNGAEPDSTEDDTDGVVLIRSATRRDEETKVLAAQAELSGVHNYRDIPHYVLFGFSATGVNEDVAFLASDPDDDPFAIDPFAPIYGGPIPPPEFERDSREQTRQYSLYGQDLLKIGDRWRLLLSVRYDHIEQSGSDAVSGSRFDTSVNEWTPRVGIVFKPIPTWSWFVSYSESIDPNEGLQPNGSALAPTHSKALEAGLKWEAEDYPVRLDTSVYAIRQTNVTTDAPGSPGFEIQNAEQESLGFDFELRGEPGPWLSLTARYSFIDAQIINDPEVTDGTTPLNVAKHQFGALALARGTFLKRDDLSLGVSLNYLSDRQGSLDPDELTLKLPDYFRGDIFVNWKQSDILSLELGIENFTDEDYIQGSQSDGLHLMPGRPITVRGQLRWSF